MSHEKFNQYIDAKKIKARAEKLSDMTTKGDSKQNLIGANEVLKKIYQAIKDVPRVKLDDVSLSMFGDKKSAYLKADNFIIGKQDDTFFLFKASEIKKTTPEVKKKLNSALQKALSQSVEQNMKLDDFTKDIPFSEWKPLSKTDIDNRVYALSKEEEKVAEEILNYSGKEKLTKKLTSSLSFGDLQYIFSQKESMQKTELGKLMTYYRFEKSDVEFRLSRSANKDIIVSPELKEYDEKLKHIEEFIYNHHSKIDKLNKDNAPQKEKSVALINVATEFLKYRDTLKVIISDMDTRLAISQKDTLDFIFIVSNEENNELSFTEKNTITAKPDTPHSYKKIGLKRENEVVDFFNNDKGKEVAKALDIELLDDIKIINFGTFTEETPQKAIENLVLYAKSLNEMVELNNADEISNIQNGDFAI